MPRLPSDPTTSSCPRRHWPISPRWRCQWPISTVTNNSSYNLQDASSNSTEIASQNICIDASSSLCYEYRVQNIASNNIEVIVEYVPNTTINFDARYSVNGTDNGSLSSASIFLAQDEEVVISVFIQVSNPCLDARLDGSVNVIAALLAE